jgi:hypothetical protein
MANPLFAQAAAWAPNPMNPPQYFDLPTKDVFSEQLLNGEIKVRPGIIFTLLPAWLSLSVQTSAQAQAAKSSIPDLQGIWDGSTRARPVNSETVPWGKDNFPQLNERDGRRTP